MPSRVQRHACQTMFALAPEFRVTDCSLRKGTNGLAPVRKRPASGQCGLRGAAAAATAAAGGSMGEGKPLNKTFSSLPTTIFEVVYVVVTTGEIRPRAPAAPHAMICMLIRAHCRQPCGSFLRGPVKTAGCMRAGHDTFKHGEQEHQPRPGCARVRSAPAGLAGMWLLITVSRAHTPRISRLLTGSAQMLLSQYA